MSREKGNKATRVKKIFWSALQFQIAQFTLNLRKSLICVGIAVRGTWANCLKLHGHPERVGARNLNNAS